MTKKRFCTICGFELLPYEPYVCDLCHDKYDNDGNVDDPCGEECEVCYPDED